MYNNSDTVGYKQLRPLSEYHSYFLFFKFNIHFSVFSMYSMCFCIVRLYPTLSLSLSVCVCVCCVCEHQVLINVLVCQYLGMRFGRGMQLLGSLQFIVATVRETHHQNLNEINIIILIILKQYHKMYM